jgi:hypothetical protein
MSTGELQVTGRTATYELRMPAYEITELKHPETALLNEIHFGDAQMISSKCKTDGTDYVCRAEYEFAHELPDKVDVECTLFRVTVPNHIHILYVVQGANSDQKVFDQITTAKEMRFHPPSAWESITRDGSAGGWMMLRSVSGLLFLCMLALTARSWREAAALTGAFLTAEWAVRPVAPLIPLTMSTEFLEALMALTVAYLAGELLFLPDGRARWVIVPLLGLIHGLPFVSFPALYLGGATVVQAVLVAGLALIALRMPAAWRRPVAGLLLLASAAWFARFLLA